MASPPIGAPASLFKRSAPVQASFTWNRVCGDKVACGAGSAARDDGTGVAAINKQAFLNPNGGIDGKGNTPYVYGASGACGSCWHLQPVTNLDPSSKTPLGTPVVVRINDECADAGVCDQGSATPDGLSSKYKTPVHFDLCTEGGNNGAAGQFFGQTPDGNLPNGQVLGLAQYDPGCELLNSGPFGSLAGTLG
ncbi:MAG: hypothetical protein Q9168_008022 [Polycauliona sp. 1 TL-2023]